MSDEIEKWVGQWFSKYAVSPDSPCSTRSRITTMQSMYLTTSEWPPDPSEANSKRCTFIIHQSNVVSNPLLFFPRTIRCWNQLPTFLTEVSVDLPELHVKSQSQWGNRKCVTPKIYILDSGWAAAASPWVLGGDTGKRSCTVDLHTL